MPRRGRATLAAVTIILFWVVMMGVLLQREVFVDRAVPGGGGRAEHFDTWMAIYAGDSEASRVGFIHSEAKPERRRGVQGTGLSITVKLAAELMSTDTEILVTGTAFSTAAKGLSEFDFKVQSFGHAMRVLGAIEDEQLDLRIETAGESFPLSFPIDQDLMLSGNMGTTTLNLPALEVGDEVLVDAFDPMTLSARTARIKCVGTEVLDIMGSPVATRILKARHGGIETTFWVAGDEEIVQIRTPFGFLFRKTTQDEAMANLKPGEAKDLLDALAVEPRGKTPFRGAKRMRVRLSNVPDESLPPAEPLQAVVGKGVYEITRPAEPESISDAFTRDMVKHLESDPFIQADSERIRLQAESLIDAQDRTWSRAMKIYRWVYENITKTIVLSFPSALDVLETREGDCNEHTVLFTALARSVDVPTRIAIGVVWSETLQGFYYHAWPEVYVGNWIPMDPTLGQPLADATHIKLLTGSIEKWPQLVPFLGQLRIEVLSVE